MKRAFKTVRGFLAGTEPNGKIYFSYSASLRIFGDTLDPEEISANLGLQPTKLHLKGEKPDPRHRGFRHAMWSYTVPLDRACPLNEHIDALWKKLKPHKDYLIELRRSLNVDIFLTYSSNCDNSGIVVPSESLAMFTELQIPFGLSIVVT
jgi:hypothetical protein